MKKEVDKRNIKWVKVEGHSGNILNERCDEIATIFADGKNISLYSGPTVTYEVLDREPKTETKKIAAAK